MFTGHPNAAERGKPAAAKRAPPALAGPVAATASQAEAEAKPARRYGQGIPRWRPAKTAAQHATPHTGRTAGKKS